MKQFTPLENSFDIQRMMLSDDYHLVVPIGILLWTIYQHGNDTVVIAMMLGVFMLLVFGLYLNTQRKKRQHESYLLKIHDDIISREQHGKNTIEIPIPEITNIIKSKRGHFTIKGKRLKDTILVPAQMKNYAELEQILSDIQKHLNL